MKYSIVKGLLKGLKSMGVFVLPIIIALLPTGIKDLTIQEIVQEHLLSSVGALSIGGLFTMLLNYIKVAKINNP